jgi:hypothetical protein
LGFTYVSTRISLVRKSTAQETDKLTHYQILLYHDAHHFAVQHNGSQFPGPTSRGFLQETKFGLRMDEIVGWSCDASLPTSF